MACPRYVVPILLILMVEATTTAGLVSSSNHVAKASTTIPFVIITSPSMVAALQPLANWKNSTGVAAQVVTTSWISTSFSGADLQEAIRNFIIYMYSNWGTRWVLLGGGISSVPIRYIYDPTSDSDAVFLGYPSAVEGYVPSDIYYATIDNNWFNATSGVYDATTATPSNMLRQVAVGRLPFDDATTMQRAVSKVIAFERQPNTQLKVLQIGTNMTYTHLGLPDFSYATQFESFKQKYFSSWNATSIYTSTPTHSAVFSAFDLGWTVVNFGSANKLNSLWGTEYDPENSKGHFSLTSSFYSYQDPSQQSNSLLPLVWLATSLSGAPDSSYWTNSTADTQGGWLQSISPGGSYSWLVPFTNPGSILYFNGNISGGPNLDVNITVRDPQGNLVFDYGRVQYNFSITFVPPAQLGYFITFNNSFSNQPKIIDVTYEVNVTTSDLASPLMASPAGAAAVIAETRTTYFASPWTSNLIGKIMDSFYNQSLLGGYRGNYVGESLAYARRAYLTSATTNYTVLRPLIATNLYGDPQMALLRNNFTFSIIGPAGYVQGARIDVYGPDGASVSTALTGPTGQATLLLPLNMGDNYTYSIQPPSPLYLARGSQPSFTVGTETSQLTVSMILGYNITVSVAGSELQVPVSIDGIKYPPNQTFLFVPRSNHVFSIPPIQTDPSSPTRYRYIGLSASGGVQVSGDTFFVDDNGALTFTYQKQYYVQVFSTLGNVSGSGWYDANSKAALSSSPSIDFNNFTRVVFIGWATDWQGNATPNALMVNVDNYYTFVATWQRQYYITVSTPYAIATGEGWYNESSIATIALSSITVEYGNSTRDIFIGWNNGNPAQTQQAKVISPASYMASWKRQYVVDVTSSHPTSVQSGWYDAGSTLSLRIESDKVEVSFLTYDVFDGWKVNGVPISGNNVVINAPLTVESTWHRDVTSLYELVGGVVITFAAVIVTVLVVRRRSFRPLSSV